MLTRAEQTHPEKKGGGHRFAKESEINLAAVGEAEVQHWGQSKPIDGMGL